MFNPIEHQIELEHLYNKNQLISRVKEEFTGTKEILEYLDSVDLDNDFAISFMTQMAIHKRCSLSTMVGILRHKFSTLQEVADEILKCVEADLVDWNEALKILIVKFTISDDVQQEIDRYQFPLPMVIEPMEVTNNKTNGYIATSGSIILKDNYHDDDVCLDHINRMNKVRFQIDRDTAMMVKNGWRDLDKPKEGETRDDYQKRVKAFEKYDRTAKDVMEKIHEHSDTFYLTHKYDKRGRVYCQG